MDGIKWEERTLADVAARLEEVDEVISKAESYASRLDQYYAFRKRLQSIVRDRVTDFPPVEGEIPEQPQTPTPSEGEGDNGICSIKPEQMVDLSSLAASMADDSAALGLPIQSASNGSAETTE